MPFQVGKAVPSNHPACLPSQVTSHFPYFFGTPTIGIVTFRLGISSNMSVCAYDKSCGCSGRVVTTFGLKPVAGSAFWAGRMARLAASTLLLVTSPIVFCPTARLAVLLMGGLPRLLTRVVIVRVTTSVTSKGLFKVT